MILMVWALQTTHFSIKIRSTIHVFSDTPFWTSFLTLLGDLVLKVLLLGPLSGPSWAQNGTPNHKNYAKKT